MSGLPPAYFDRLYADHDDPWGFAERWYERRKRAVTLAALPDERYGDAFEPGCSIGVLTAELAARCDRLLATDVAPAALVQARLRTAHLDQVRLEQRAVPEQWPDGRFDLVVLSELGYYLDGAGCDELAARAAGSLRPGGVLVAVHWRHPVTDYPLAGDAVHRSLAGRPEWRRTVSHEEEDFRLEVYRVPVRADEPLSVAGRTGLLAAS